MLATFITRLQVGESLSITESAAAMESIMEGRETDESTIAFLIALAEKGESFTELAGAAQAIRSRMLRVRTTRTKVLDTCGTGGDRSGTFNISTAAAIVTAAAGVAVAKHGNRSITSKTGSADVLRELGVEVEAPLRIVERCLEELGVCFCFAPQLHPAVARVAQIRRNLGRPTVFNWVGPLCNPANAPYQLLGVGQPALRLAMAQASQALGTTRGAVVCGADGLDEITLATTTQVSLAGPERVAEMTWHPSDFGIATASLNSLKVDDVSSSAAMIRSVLAGARGSPRDIVVMNAAAALWVVHADGQLTDYRASAEQAIDSGAAARLLAELARLTHESY